MSQQHPAADPEATRQVPRVQVDETRNLQDGSRTSPRMRLDGLQVVAWAIGLYFLVAALVALARTGFEDVGLFEPTVEVSGLPMTPLLALLQLIVGIALLGAATGVVHERGLRVGGVLLGVLGAVWLIEPFAFEPYLGVVRDTGAAWLTMAVVLVASSFIPPLSIARPGVSPAQQRPPR
jgi:hypothetical protein